MEYHIFQKEIERRKKASLTLIISLVLGFALAGLIIKLIVFWLATCALFIFATLGLLRKLALSFFKSYQDLKIYFQNDDLVRQTQNQRVRYSLESIQTLNLTRTSRGQIRDLKLCFQNGRKVFIDTLEEMESFKDTLIVKCNKNLRIKEYHEPLDYDHWAFYLILGLIIGFAITWTMNFLVMSDMPIVTLILAYVFSIYLSLLGMYFILAKPLSQRYQNASQLVDYACGISFVYIS